MNKPSVFHHGIPNVISHAYRPLVKRQIGSKDNVVILKLIIVKLNKLHFLITKRRYNRILRNTEDNTEYILMK